MSAGIPCAPSPLQLSQYLLLLYVAHFTPTSEEWEVRDQDKGKKVGGEEERALRERTTVGSPQPPNGRNGIGMAFLFGDCYHRGVHRTSDQVLDSQKECLSCMQ